ncbi:helix-turn-helix domain-containing protein [Saccharothrix sp. NPDC042600]|uniref:PucR family transcriptional regulator n=1 Tax=Saccharothrix TaxID=2071 RepID=UPI0033CE51FD|nr:helix-turn-helix domain-containing protein [Saccharothrix mutabilis subsp. capreolus]
MVATTSTMSPLPPELNEIVRGQLGRLPQLADELARLLSEKEEFYRRLEQSSPQELRKVCEVNLGRAFRAFLEAREVDVETARKTGRAQARLGIPISAALRAFRIAGTFAYEGMLEHAVGPRQLTPEQLLSASATVWHIIDSFSDVIAEAYTEVATDSARYDNKARLALIDGLLDGRFTRPEEFEDAARVLRLPAEGPFVVVYAEPRAEDDRGLSGLVDPRSRAVWRRTAEGEVGVVPVERSADLRALRQALDAASFPVGVSPAVAGLRLLPAALRRARIARACLAPGETGAVGFGDRPVTTMVAGAPKLARELAKEVLKDLLALPEAEREPLLRTMQVWFAEHGSARDAAERLFVHPNTVRYRIRRVQELTGRDLTDPRGISELYLAVESVRLES